MPACWVYSKPWRQNTSLSPPGGGGEVTEESQCDTTFAMLLRHARKYIFYPGAPGRSWRSISSNSPSIILGLSVVAGLPIALWTYKVYLMRCFV